MPTASVHGTAAFDPEAVTTVPDCGQMYAWQGRSLPLISAYAVLDRKPASDIDDSRRMIMVFGDGVTDIATIVDAVIVRQQVVLKPLGEELPRVDAVSGATVTADGGIALVIDPTGFVRHGLHMSENKQRGQIA